MKHADGRHQRGPKERWGEPATQIGGRYGQGADFVGSRLPFCRGFEGVLLLGRA